MDQVTWEHGPLRNGMPTVEAREGHHRAVVYSFEGHYCIEVSGPKKVEYRLDVCYGVWIAEAKTFASGLLRQAAIVPHTLNPRHYR